VSLRVFQVCLNIQSGKDTFDGHGKGLFVELRDTSAYVAVPLSLAVIFTLAFPIAPFPSSECSIVCFVVNQAIIPAQLVLILLMAPVSIARFFSSLLFKLTCIPANQVVTYRELTLCSLLLRSQLASGGCSGSLTPFRDRAEMDDWLRCGILR